MTLRASLVCLRDGRLMSEVCSINTISYVVSQWAANEPLIRRIYLYGSRARGDHRPNSDIDLAIFYNVDLEILSYYRGNVPIAQKMHNARRGTWNENAASWVAALEARLPVRVHIESVERTFKRVWPSLKQCRILLYRRGVSA